MSSLDVSARLQVVKVQAQPVVLLVYAGVVVLHVTLQTGGADWHCPHHLPHLDRQEVSKNKARMSYSYDWFFEVSKFILEERDDASKLG